MQLLAKSASAWAPKSPTAGRTPAGSRDRPSVRPSAPCVGHCTTDRRLFPCTRTPPQIPGRSPSISPAQTRSRGCRIPNTDAVPSPPVLGCDALAATATGANSPETHRRSCKAACVPAAAAGSRPGAARVARVGKPTTVAEQCRWPCGHPWRESIACPTPPQQSHLYIPATYLRVY